MLQGVEVVVALRHLHDGHGGIGEEAQRALEIVGARHVVGVEGGNHVAGGLAERVVPVAGLGVLVGVAGQVLAAEFVAERLHLGPAPIVEHEGAVRVAHVDRAADGLPQQVHVFVEGRDEDVHRHPGRDRRHLTAAEFPDLEVVEDQREEAVDLGQVDGQGEDQRVRIDRVQAAVDQVAEIDGNREERHHFPGDASGGRIEERERPIGVHDVSVILNTLNRHQVNIFCALISPL